MDALRKFHFITRLCYVERTGETRELNEQACGTKRLIKCLVFLVITCPPSPAPSSKKPNAKPRHTTNNDTASKMERPELLVSSLQTSFDRQSSFFVPPVVFRHLNLSSWRYSYLTNTTILLEPNSSTQLPAFLESNRQANRHLMGNGVYGSPGKEPIFMSLVFGRHFRHWIFLRRERRDRNRDGKWEKEYSRARAFSFRREFFCFFLCASGAESPEQKA